MYVCMAVCMDVCMYNYIVHNLCMYSINRTVYLSKSKTSNTVDSEIKLTSEISLLAT